MRDLDEGIKATTKEILIYQEKQIAAHEEQATLRSRIRTVREILDHAELKAQAARKVRDSLPFTLHVALSPNYQL